MQINSSVSKQICSHCYGELLIHEMKASLIFFLIDWPKTVSLILNIEQQSFISVFKNVDLSTILIY